MAPIVFIHGLKGSVLVNEKNEVKWLERWGALGFSTPTLNLPLKWNLTSQQSDHLLPEEPLGKVTILKNLFEEKVYSPWINAAQKWDYPFYSFVYDWRRDNLESLEKFKIFLKEIQKKHFGKKVTVVAHSMGGLITLALVNQYPELFEKIVFAGVPFQGGIGFLSDIHQGDVVGLNKKILSAEVIFSFPSVYSFFSLLNSNMTKHLIEKNGNPIDMDFFSIKDWKKNQLGIYSNHKKLKIDENTDLFLSTALSQSKKFRNLLEPKKQIYPDILVISGQSTPSLVQVIKEGPKSFEGWDFETAPQDLGDGRVSIKNSLPPKGIKYRIFYSDQTHSNLLNDPQVIHEIYKFSSGLSSLEIKL